MKRFKPKSVSLTAPAIPFSLNDSLHPPSDHYYRLDLSDLSIRQKVRNMLTRAGRELSVGRRRDWGEEHRKMVYDFLKTHPVEEPTRLIFERIGEYLSASATAWVFDARNKSGDLVAFDVGEFNPKDYVFFMFNFSSDALCAPGASDLLLFEMIQEAKREGKRYINLGLGINPGITFFKKKWGGTAFLPYAFFVYRPSGREELDTLFQKL